jgi:hypothetical protein
MGGRLEDFVLNGIWAAIVAIKPEAVKKWRNGRE